MDSCKGILRSWEFQPGMFAELWRVGRWWPGMVAWRRIRVGRWTNDQGRYHRRFSPV